MFRLGASTATGDAEGEVLETRPVTVSRREIESAIQHFTGAIEQVPPMYSAIKQDGQPLYKLARAGMSPSARRARSWSMNSLSSTWSETP